MNIILYLLQIIQYQYKIIGQLFNFICRYIPLKQRAFDDSHSPKYQKLKVDELPIIISFEQDWKWNDLIPYYLHNLRKVIKEHPQEDKHKYKLHYIYREFQIDFFKMDLNSLPKNASSLKFSKFDQHVMGLCLSYKVNLGLSLRKTAHVLHEIHGIKISHQQVANYLKTAAVCVKPFVDNYDYQAGSVFTADETYIKIRGIKGYIWFIMDAAKRSIIGYRISDNRGVGPCIMLMRMAFKHLKELPKNFKFIADGYSAYPLAAQQFFVQSKSKINFDITQVIGLTNDDAVSKAFRPYKPMIERLNRTYKQSYRPSNGFDNIDGANYVLALWVAYYNFLSGSSCKLRVIEFNFTLASTVQNCQLPFSAKIFRSTSQVTIFLRRLEMVLNLRDRHCLVITLSSVSEMSCQPPCWEHSGFQGT